VELQLVELLVVLECLLVQLVQLEQQVQLAQQVQIEQQVQLAQQVQLEQQLVALLLVQNSEHVQTLEPVEFHPLVHQQQVLMLL
jgi:hypothetical protein